LEACRTLDNQCFPCVNPGSGNLKVKGALPSTHTTDMAQDHQGVAGVLHVRVLGRYHY